MGYHSCDAASRARITTRRALSQKDGDLRFEIRDWRFPTDEAGLGDWGLEMGDLDVIAFIIIGQISYMKPQMAIGDWRLEIGDLRLYQPRISRMPRIYLNGVSFTGETHH
jgi:hypothetical protein